MLILHTLHSIGALGGFRLDIFAPNPGPRLGLWPPIWAGGSGVGGGRGGAGSLSILVGSFGLSLGFKSPLHTFFSAAGNNGLRGETNTSCSFSLRHNHMINIGFVLLSNDFFITHLNI